MIPDQLSTLSDTLFTTSVVIYAVAALVFCAELAFGRTGVRARNEPAMVGAGVGQAGEADPRPVSSTAGSGGRWGRLGVLLTGLGALANAGVLVARGLATGRVPWGNMYEFGTAAVLAGVLAYLFFAVRVPAIRRIGVFVLGIVVIGMVLIGLYLYAESGPLVAALRSEWLVVHVSAAIISFGIFLVSAVASALYLVALRWEKQPSDGGRDVGGLVESLPRTAVLDRVAHRAAVFGFPIWTFAVIAGAIWAEAAWGRFWGWDPKETWAFISWALYAAYLHARTTAGWRGARAAWVNLVAFATLVFNLLFVNLVSAGLHSYGGVS